MMFARFIAAGLIAAAGAGAAHAQAAACQPLSKLMTSSHAQVKALQGAQTEKDKDSITYVSKTQAPGMTDCTIQSNLAIDKFTDYWEHHLSCQADTVNSEAATQAIEALWACTKDIFSERQPNEAWIGGKYRVIGFEGEVQTNGRAAGLVAFGDTDYARIDIEKPFDTSNEYSMHIYWMFTK